MYRYDEWGNILQSSETISNPFKYAGEVYDQETGLYYLRARYYDPTVGRFLNEDMVEGQINNPLSLNVYSYCYNNPLIYSDPSGHVAIPWLPGIPIPYVPEFQIFEDGLNLIKDIGKGFLRIFGIKSIGESTVSTQNPPLVGPHQAPTMPLSLQIDWDVNDNTINHILNGSEDSHSAGWKKFGLDPKDPKSYYLLLPYLKEAVDKGEETWRNVDGGRIFEYVYKIAEKAFTIWVKIFEHPDGTRVISDAAEYIVK